MFYIWKYCYIKCIILIIATAVSVVSVLMYRNMVKIILSSFRVYIQNLCSPMKAVPCKFVPGIHMCW